MKNAKQVVLLGSAVAKRKGGDGVSFLAHEIAVLQEFNLPVVVANLGGSREIRRDFIPKPLLDADYYTLSVSFRSAIIRHALDGYVTAFHTGAFSGPHYYPADQYRAVGL